MKVGDKVVIRASAQTWGDYTPYASHWYGVLDNTETTWSTTAETGRDTREEAVLDAVREFVNTFSLDEYILVVVMSQSEMCMDWN